MSPVANGNRGNGFLSDPTSLQALSEFHAEQRRGVLHRPASGAMPRVIPAGQASTGAPIGKVRPKRTVILRSAAAIKPEGVNWLWSGWLALGKLHVIAGAPGAGKTTIAMSLVASVRRGGLWPDGSRCPAQGRVVIWSGEDDPADTLIPRLIAAGADLSRVSFTPLLRTSIPFHRSRIIKRSGRARKSGRTRPAPASTSTTAHRAIR